MQVSGRNYQLLNEALVDAFVLDSLEAMLQFGLGERLDVLVGRTNLNITVFKLIEEFNRRDRVEKLLQAARRFNSTNGKLHQVAQSLGRATQVKAHLEGDVLSIDALELEKTVRRRLPKLSAVDMRQQMMRVEGQMCVIERRFARGEGQALGSGFLIGPNAVLTNYHVVQNFLHGSEAKRLQVRFDALLEEDGVREPDQGVVIEVDEVPIAQPPTEKDKGNVNQPPAPNELDFAILLLAEEAGHMQVGGIVNALQSSTPRGWIKLPDPNPAVLEGDPLIIYQYPGGRELMLAIDTEAVIGTVWDGKRLRYRNNTEPGSSGSPVFNFEWELVALHHAGAPGGEPAPYNQGIPIARIKEFLAEKEMTHLLGT